MSLGVLLGTFMGGMCLGSLLLSRLVSARQHPLRVREHRDRVRGVGRDVADLRGIGVEIEEVNQSTLQARRGARGLHAGDLITEPYPLREPPCSTTRTPWRLLASWPIFAAVLADASESRATAGTASRFLPASLGDAAATTCSSAEHAAANRAA